MSDDLFHAPPVAQTVQLVAATHGDTDEIVAVLRFSDVTGETRAIAVHPDTALDLLAQLAQFLRQVGIEK